MIIQDNVQCQKRAMPKGIKLPFRFLFASIMSDTDGCLNKPTNANRETVHKKQSMKYNYSNYRWVF